MTDQLEIVAFIKARLDEREQALRDLAMRRAADAIPAIEMQMHHAMQIVATYPHHGMSHFEHEAWQELGRGIETKRRILELHEHQTFDFPDPTTGNIVGCIICHSTYQDFPGGWCATVKALASEWSTHEAYRAEWKL